MSRKPKDPSADTEQKAKFRPALEIASDLHQAILKRAGRKNREVEADLLHEAMLALRHMHYDASGREDRIRQLETARVIPVREQMPEERAGITRRFEIPWQGETLKIYATASRYPDGRIGELFLKADRQGSLASGALDAVAMTISVGLQYGIPLEAFTSKLRALRFEPAGLTGDKKYPTASSALDLVARWLDDTAKGEAKEEEKTP